MKPGAAKPQRRSIRLPGFDYAEARAYFLTICSHNRKCIFGHVANDEMRVNALGQIVGACWREMPGHFRGVELDAFTVMPNHVHGIVVIAGCRGTACRAPTVERFGKPMPRSLPTIIRSFKSAATRHVNVMRGTPRKPVWQRNYYEHIIRNQEESNLIRKYIADNPLLWALDRENPAASTIQGRGTACRAPTDEVEAILYGSRKMRDRKPYQDITA